MDYEQLAQENAIFPWLDSDCMSDIYDEDELDKQLIEEYYDDLASGLPLDSSNDF